MPAYPYRAGGPQRGPYAGVCSHLGREVLLCSRGLHAGGVYRGQVGGRAGGSRGRIGSGIPYPISGGIYPRAYAYGYGIVYPCMYIHDPYPCIDDEGRRGSSSLYPPVSSSSSISKSKKPRYSGCPVVSDPPPPIEVVAAEPPGVVCDGEVACGVCHRTCRWVWRLSPDPNHVMPDSDRAGLPRSCRRKVTLRPLTGRPGR